MRGSRALWRAVSRAVAPELENAPKKAEEEIGGGWRKDLKRFGKYLVVIAPALAGAAVTTLVVNSKAAKETIEYVLPFYIDLVRQYVGFQEEDLEGMESARIRDETIASSLDATVTIKYRHGSQTETLHFEDLKGLMLCSELMDMVRNKLASASFPGKSDSDSTGQIATDWESLLKNVDISFDFSNPRETAPREDEKNKDPYSTKALMHREREELLERLGAIQKSRGSVGGLHSSLWTEMGSSLPSMKELQRKQKQLLDNSSTRQDRSSPVSPIENCRHALHVQFCNKVEHIRGGLLAYTTLTRQDSVLHALRSHYNSRERYIETEQRKLSVRSAADISASKEKAQAVERVKELEARVKRLNDELAMGTRPIDDVLDDLGKAKAEITRLRRTYINTLYFF